ncbi:MAG: hypothetical protein HGB01_00700 [Chlorobiaceae bacterium]|nr:hypothetical protein [Chlorobiaceae bacterium]
MIISMQGNWTVSVKSKSASFDQRFIVSGATTGNGVHNGTAGTTVHVTGAQWSIAIQNNPGSGFQLSDTRLTNPRQVSGNYEFDILSNDAGGDEDFNDLILTCKTPVNINDFILYGKVSLYSGRCIFNPCRKQIFVIETRAALREALKNARLRKILEEYYPERTKEDIIGPLPPDPAPFKPIVIDIYNEATQPNTELLYQRIESEAPAQKTKAKSTRERSDPEFAVANFQLIDSVRKQSSSTIIESSNLLELAKVIDGLYARNCTVAPAPNTTLSFEEYDRTAAELAGGPYTGNGNRRLLGDTITDMAGNYIFRFSFDMTFPDIEDTSDIAPGESINVVAYPDIIVKVTSFSPYNVLYESAPYFNVPNLKRIDLCLPKSQIQPSSACFNGNLIGSLGNVFIGGNQNTAASFTAAALRRYGYSNYLEENGIVSVNSSLAGFTVECAPWCGTIDFKGCMYDLAKTVAQNTARWYTIRIKRSGVANWQFVSENYKHPRFSKRHLPGYIGDDVGPFTQALHVDGGPAQNVPAYKNIQREIFVDGIDWEFSNFDRYIQLNTALYDIVSGVRTPGTFHIRVDCYDGAGHPVPNGTDMIALFIHNNPLNFGMTAPAFTDPLVENSGCGLFRLTDAQLNTPIELTFKANDPEGFVHFFDLSMARCPAPMISLSVSQPVSKTTPSGATPQPHPTTPAGRTTLFNGISGSVHNSCSGYTGTTQEFSDAGMITVSLQPAPTEGGWIKPGEYFTSLSFYLLAYKRQTNGYNSGLSVRYDVHQQLLMERINP